MRTDSDFARLVASYRSTRDRYWLTRHYVAASTLTTYAIAAIAPGSLNAQAIDAAGEAGWWVLGILTLISLASLVEAFVTAFVPRLTCEWLRRRRHTLFMAMAMGQLCLGYAVIAYAPAASALILRFALDATVAALLAFLDLFARHKAAAPA
jgi:uncharacterized membrane protein YhaH (DUF805 family)